MPAANKPVVRISGVERDLMIGEIIEETDTHVILKVPKDMNQIINIAESSKKFMTILFVHQVGGKMFGWMPWSVKKK